MSRPLVVALLLGLAAGSLDARADEKTVTPDGTVHWVVVEPLQLVAQPGGWAGGGTALRYTRQSPDGVQESMLLPGTVDLAIDAEPTLDVIASTNQPIVIWTRNEGAGSFLSASKIVAGEWTPIRRIFPGGVASNPHVQNGSDWAHLTWRELGPTGPRFLRGVLDPATLDEVHGPEPLPTAQHDGDPVHWDGEREPGTSPEPSADYLYASGLVVSPRSGAEGTAYVWGVRDEPIPIIYFEGFVLPEDAGDIRSVDTHWLNGRFTIAYESDDRIRYMMREAGRWTDLRTIDLDEETGPAEALLQVMEMIRKDSLRNKGE